MIEILVGLNVTDENMYQNYRDGMTPILERMGGFFSYDFRVSETLKSRVSHDINRVFIIRFPNAETRKEFFNNSEYKKIRQKYFDNSVSDTALIAEYEVSPDDL